VDDAAPTASSSSSFMPSRLVPDEKVIALRIRCPGETWNRETAGHRHEEAVITAIIAAVLFAIALLLHLGGLALGPLDSTFFMLAGLVAAALHLAGIGTTYRGRVRR
jgi:hypothetical protein